MSTTEEARAYKMFLGDVEGHRMTVLKSEGLYRHVRFGNPNGSSIYRFDLVTWPGHLVITGDFQDYHFARVPDMFTFFRTRHPGEINAQYWAEKLVGHHQRYEGFSFDRFKEQVVQHFLWNREYIPEGRRREVFRAIREEVLEAEGVEYSADVAVQAAMGFRYFDWKNGRRETVWDGFQDVWDWSVQDYDYHYLVSLHAIVWGIAQWDTREHKTEAQWLREDLNEARAYLRALGDEEKGHIVRFDDQGYVNAQHPLHERVGNQLLDCVIHDEVKRFVQDGHVVEGTWNVTHRDYVRGEQDNEFPYIWKQLKS